MVALGVDPDYFNPGITGHPLAGVFSFLSTFEWGSRKAPELLLRAFNDEFRAVEDVVLLCKIINVDESVRVERAVADLGLASGGGRVLFSLNELVPTHQLGSLYRSADCFVLPSRGEGWGMPILEAMACGLPVIATDWSAPRDFMNAGNAYPLAVERMIPAELTSPYYRGAQWAEPSYEHLRVLMRHVYEHRDEALEKGLRASREVLSRWTWDHSASRISARVAEVMRAQRQLPPVPIATETSQLCRSSSCGHPTLDSSGPFASGSSRGSRSARPVLCDPVAAGARAAQRRNLGIETTKTIENPQRRLQMLPVGRGFEVRIRTKQPEDCCPQQPSGPPKPRRRPEGNARLEHVLGFHDVPLRELELFGEIDQRRQWPLWLWHGHRLWWRGQAGGV